MAEDPRSPLPEDPAYWESLARRVSADAAPTLARYAGGNVWYGVLARRAPWLVAAAAVIAAVLMLLVPAPDADSSVAYRWIEASMAPDETAGVLIAGASPPSVDAVLVQFDPPPHTQEVR